MKFSILLLCISYLFAFSSFAGEDEKDKIYVETFGDDIDPSELKEDKRYIVNQNKPDKSFTGELPSPTIQKGMLAKAGFEKDLMNMDQMDLDILCSKLMRRPFEIVIKQYPHLDKNKLLVLKNLLLEKMP